MNRLTIHLVVRRSILSLLFGLLLLSGEFSARAQYFELAEPNRPVRMQFKLVRNMIVVPMKIGGKGPYNFILDSGAGILLITDPNLLDSSKLVGKRTIIVKGITDEETFEALITEPLDFTFPGIHSVNVRAAILKKDHFGISNYAGIPIHGLIGHDFFNRLQVKLNFNDSVLIASTPGKNENFKKYQRLPISIEAGKPYLETPIRFYDGTERSAKLLIDIGAGHALSLENRQRNRWPARHTIKANLGIGLTGPITGEISRVSSFALGKYKLTNLLSAFPNNVMSANPDSTRHGNLGLDVLKRFNVIFDYQNGFIYVRSRGVLRDPFEHDMSGLEYFAEGDKFQHVLVSRVEPGSPGAEEGILERDELLSINLRPMSEMSLEEVDKIFKSGDGRSLLLEIGRNKKAEKVIITLKRRI